MENQLNTCTMASHSDCVFTTLLVNFLNLTLLIFLCLLLFFFSFPLLEIGDFGNENVDLVQSVADLQFPKAVILGNHDSWCTQQFSQK